MPDWELLSSQTSHSPIIQLIIDYSGYCAQVSAVNIKKMCGHSKLYVNISEQIQLIAYIKTQKII